MPTKKELIIDFRDLRRLSVECPKCGRVTIFDIERDTIHSQDTNVGFMAPHCPRCHLHFDEDEEYAQLKGVVQSIESYRFAYQKLEKFGAYVQARIPAPE